MPADLDERERLIVEAVAKLLVAEHKRLVSLRMLPVDELPQYLTVAEVQEYLQIGRSAAYDFARQHGVKFGRVVRVPREALNKGVAK